MDTQEDMHASTAKRHLYMEATIMQLDSVKIYRFIETHEASLG